MKRCTAMASYLNAFVPLCPFLSVPLELGLINQEQNALDFDAWRESKLKCWWEWEQMYYQIFDTEQWEHRACTAILLGIYSADCAHTQFNLLYWCVWHVPHPDPLPHSAVNTMTGLLNHQTDLAVAQSFYPLLVESAWGDMWLLLRL